MNNSGIRAELIQIVSYPIIEARAYGKNNIRMVHSRVGFERTVHTQHTEILRISARVTTQTHQSIGHRIIQRLSQGN